MSIIHPQCDPRHIIASFSFPVQQVQESIYSLYFLKSYSSVIMIIKDIRSNIVFNYAFKMWAVHLETAVIHQN